MQASSPSSESVPSSSVSSSLLSSLLPSSSVRFGRVEAELMDVLNCNVPCQELAEDFIRSKMIEGLLWIAHCTLYSVHIPLSVLQVPSPATLLQRALGLSADSTKFHHKQRGCKHEEFLRHKSTKLEGQKLHHSQCRTWFDASSLKQSRRSNRPKED